MEMMEKCFLTAWSLEPSLVVVDIQEKLLPTMSQSEQVVENTMRLMRGATLLEVPVLLSEQYPKGLGPTIPEINALVEEEDKIAKVSFSCGGEPAFVEALETIGRRQAVVCGIEAHVCVQQTAFDLMKRDYKVFVASDATSSRTEENHRLAMERLRQNGCEIVSTEMVLFEWLKSASHPSFKEISALVR